ncbi:DNA binding protein [[Candida] boidinii]|nr:DNA binding protein [[Candida] boidinii]
MMMSENQRKRKRSNLIKSSSSNSYIQKYDENLNLNSSSSISMTQNGNISTPVSTTNHSCNTPNTTTTTTTTSTTTPSSTHSSNNSTPKVKRPSSSIIGISRSITACKRCRLKKTKCDQKFPRCGKCEKANVDCVSIDPATGREIPRSYIVLLEDKVSLLEKKILALGGDPFSKDIETFTPPSSSASSLPTIHSSNSSNSINNNYTTSSNNGTSTPMGNNNLPNHSTTLPQNTANLSVKSETSPSIPNQNSNSNTSTPTNINSVTMNTNNNQSDFKSSMERTNSANDLMMKREPSLSDIPSPNESIMDKVENSTAISGSKQPNSYFGSSSGISFAKLMFTAVNFKGNHDSTNSITTAPNANTTTNTNNNNNQTHSVIPVMDSSMLKKSVDSQISVLPTKQQALSFISLYFAQSNSQLPILHREEFLRKYFEPIYGTVPNDISFASNYTTINRDNLSDGINPEDTWYFEYTKQLNELIEKEKKNGSLDIDSNKLASNIKAPQIFNKPLYFLNIVFAISSSVKHLQYPEHISDSFKNAALKYIDSVYASTDRLESLQSILLLTLFSIMRPAVPGVWYVLGSALRVCVDLGLHTESNLINPDSYDCFTLDIRRRLFWCCYALDRQVCVYLGRPFGIPEESVHVPFPTDLDDALIVHDDTVHDYSKRTSTMSSYKTVSLAIFKIRQIQAEVQSILYERKELPRKYKDLKEWRRNISNRLDQWKSNSPKTQRKMNCDFNMEFFNLNYNHTRVMLNGLSPGNLTLTTENYLNVWESSKNVILSYYELFQDKLVNYTWVAVHNLFMAGTSYLYSIYHCPEVRLRTSLQEIQQIALYCNLILSSLSDRCDAAIHSRAVFEILTAAVIRLNFTANIINTVDFKKLPSTSVIASSQPGNHVTEHLKNLIDNLPKSTQDQQTALNQLNASSLSQQQQQQQQQGNEIQTNQGPHQMQQIPLPNNMQCQPQQFQSIQSVQAPQQHQQQQQMLHPPQPHRGQFVPIQMQQEMQKMQAPVILPQQQQHSGIPTHLQQFPQQLVPQQLPLPSQQQHQQQQQQQIHHQQLQHQQSQQQNRMGMETDKNAMQPPQSTHTNFQPMKQDPTMNTQLFQKDENYTNNNANQLTIQTGQNLQPNSQLRSQTPDPLPYQGFASPFEWSTNEQDLDRFFDELQRVGSPMSTKSNQSPVDSRTPSETYYQMKRSDSSQIQQQQQQLQVLQQPEQLQSQSITIQQRKLLDSDLMPEPQNKPSTAGPDTGKSSGSGSGSRESRASRSSEDFEALSSNNSPHESFYQHNQSVQQMQLQIQHYNNQRRDSPGSSINQQSASRESYMDYDNSSSYRPPSSSSGIPSAMNSMIVSPTPTPSKTEGGMAESSNTNISPSNPVDYTATNRKIPSTREGQRIFKMIYQVPTESIWDQFFATPFLSDDFDPNTSHT